MVGCCSESSECPHTTEYLIGFDVCERETDTEREKQIDIETERQRDREDRETERTWNCKGGRDDYVGN